MHGLFNQALERFLRVTHGGAAWQRIAEVADLPFLSFEPLTIYDPAVTAAVVQAAAQVLDRPVESLLEDMGTFLVSHQSGERVRRLLRFGGVGFIDFLHSLEEMPARARLALPDLVLPDIVLDDLGGWEFSLWMAPPFLGAAFVLVGLLRAMADDYGALVFLEVEGGATARPVVRVQLLDAAHAEGRRFDLAAGVA